MSKLIIKFCTTGLVTLVIFGLISLIPSTMSNYDYIGGFFVAWILGFIFSLFLGG